MRLVAFADQPPPADAAQLVSDNRADAVVTLGDLEPESIASLAEVAVPRVGVHGNHDGDGALASAGIRDVHLVLAEIGGWTFAGFEGCVRYGRGGPHQYTQEEAQALVERLPAADVLLTHAPPWGINDDRSDPAHVGFKALRAWVERHEPRYVLHGHTTPDPRDRVHHLGPTTVVWVRGARVVELR